MIREATLEDVAALTELCNEHERRVDPNAEALGEDEIAMQIKGWSEPGYPLLHLDDTGRPDAVAFNHTDSARNRVEIDLFSIATAPTTAKLFDTALAWAAAERPGMDVRTAANKLDTRLTKLFESRGFDLYRIYWQMLRDHQEGDNALDDFPAGVEVLQMEYEQNLELFHRLEMESFKDHFGWVPVNFADWRTERLADDLADLAGNFILFENGEPAGYVVYSRNRENIEGGYIDKLGVLEQFRGRGYGELLLRMGIAYSAALGNTSIGLGVDSGNESGALRLYEKVGFSVNLGWAAYIKKA